MTNSPGERHGARRHWTAGKNVAIRFPAAVPEAARLGEGERVEIAASGDAVVIRKLPAQTAAQALFAGRSPETCLRSTATRPIRGRSKARAQTGGQNQTFVARLEWQERARRGCSLMVWRTPQIDPLLPFMVGPGATFTPNIARWRHGSSAQERAFEPIQFDCDRCCFGAGRPRSKAFFRAKF